MLHAGAGGLGSEVARRLGAKGIKVVVLDVAPLTSDARAFLTTSVDWCSISRLTRPSLGCRVLQGRPCEREGRTRDGAQGAARGRAPVRPLCFSHPHNAL